VRLPILLSSLLLLAAAAASPMAAIPAAALSLLAGASAVLRWMRERNRRNLLLRVLSRVRDLNGVGRAEQARELALSVIRYEIAVRLRQPVSSDPEELSPALPRAWRDLLARGSVEDLIRAAEALL